MTQTPPVQDLMQPLNFDEHDLHDNRTGKIGMSQLARLQAMQGRALLTGGIGFVVLTLAATTFLYFGAQSGILTWIGIFTTMINAIFVGMFGRQWMRLQNDIRNGDVEAISGTMERVIKPDRRVGNYIVRVGDAEFFVKKELFKLFTHDERYTIYRAPYSKVLLAAEPN